jgi:cyclopropane fatty-acyl-phospholipid synthase-like methyltransferase
VTANWNGYFDTLGHQSPLHREQARLYVEALSESVGLHRHQRVLDFGCGFGFVTALIAARVREVCWWDPSLNMRSVAERSTAECPNARLCDLSTPLAGAGEKEWEAFPFDVILVNSVVQYMTPEQLWMWLPQWRRMLLPEGKLILSDLIPPEHNGLHDIADLLRLGIRQGSPLRAASEALGGLARYWRTRTAAPLTRVDQQDLVRRAAIAGLETLYLPRNLTHFHRRRSAMLRARASP